MSVLLALLRAGGGGGLVASLAGLVWRHPWVFASFLWCGVAWWQHSVKENALAARDHARATLAAEKKARASDRAGWERQVAAAQAARAAAERTSQEIAFDAQASHQALAADNAGLRAYIAARRVRAEGSATAAALATDDLGARLPAGTAASSLVATDEADLGACDAAFVYAAGAYSWAQGLIDKGLAKPLPR